MEEGQKQGGACDCDEVCIVSTQINISTWKHKCSNGQKYKTCSRKKTGSGMFAVPTKKAEYWCCQGIVDSQIDTAKLFVEDR